MEVSCFQQKLWIWTLIVFYMIIIKICSADDKILSLKSHLATLYAAPWPVASLGQFRLWPVPPLGQCRPLANAAPWRWWSHQSSP